MNNLFSTFFQMQGLFPNIGLFLFDALKTTGIVFLGWSAASFLKSRSGVARCWVWRCTLLGVLTVLAFDFGPGTMQRFRLVFPVRMAKEQTVSFWREANALKLVRFPEEMGRLMEEKRASQAVIKVPPWQMDQSPHLTASDILAQPWSRIEAWLPKVWWGVACALVLFCAFRIAYGILWLRRGGTDAGGHMMALADDVAGVLAIKVRPKLRITSKIRSPLIFGIFCPSIFLPVAASSWGEQKLRAVFLHELSHWKRHDTLWKYLGRITSCLFWWNPFVALAARQMDAEAEIAADDAVLLHRYEAESYAAVLVDIASENGDEKIPVTGISIIGQRSLEKRIKALLVDNPWRGKMGWLGMSMVAVLLAAFMFGASIYLAHAETTDNAGKAIPSKPTPVVSVLGLRAQGGLGGWLDLGGRSGPHTPQRQIENCTAALKAHPDDAWAHYCRALVYESTCKYELAMSDFNDAIRLNPKLADAFAGRGELFAFMCDEKKALADYNTALALGGGDSLQKTYLGLDEIYSDQGDLDKCLEYDDRIVKNWPGDFSSYADRAYTYMERNEYDKAIADYSKAMEVYAGYNYPGFATDPMYVELFVERGEVYFRSGAYDKAIADFKRANYGGINAAAWFYATCPDAKFRDGSKAVSLARKGGDYDALAAGYAELGDWAKAIKAEKLVIAKEKSEDEKMVLMYKAQALETKAALMEKWYEEGIKDYTARLALYEQKKPCREVKKLEMNFQ